MMRAWEFEDVRPGARQRVSAGQVFGELTIVRTAGFDGKRRFVLARCSCGVEKTYDVANLIATGRKRSLSCGHYHREASSARFLRHGHCAGEGQTATYRAWVNLHGDNRGRVCARWGSFEAFLADMGQRPEGMTLVRLRESRPFSKSNCEWAKVRRGAVEVDGERASLAEWCRRYRRNYALVRARISYGWDTKTALTKRSQRCAAEARAA